MKWNQHQLSKLGSIFHQFVRASGFRQRHSLINHGANLADDVTYSGTVAAAMEAALLGVPSIAFSLASKAPFDFGPAARFARSIVAAALAKPLPARMLLNVNIPGGVEPDGYAVTRLGRHSYGYEVVENVDPRGRKYYWIGGNEYEHEDHR